MALVLMAFATFSMSSSLLGCSNDAHPETPVEEAPKPLPALDVTAMDGTKTHVADVVKGKVAVIDLWATWCSSCKPVSARAATLATAHAADKDFVVLGINVGEELPIVSAFVESKKPPHLIFADPQNSVTDTLGIKELPAIIVVDRDGRVLKMAHELDAKTVELIESELSKTATPAKPG